MSRREQVYNLALNIIYKLFFDKSNFFPYFFIINNFLIYYGTSHFLSGKIKSPPPVFEKTNVCHRRQRVVAGPTRQRRPPCLVSNPPPRNSRVLTPEPFHRRLLRRRIRTPSPPCSPSTNLLRFSSTEQ